MNLVIDQGNTTSKVGIFEGEILQYKQVFGSSAELMGFLSNQSFHHVIISSVSSDPSQLKEKINCSGELIMMNHGLQFPLTISYSTPDTLGTDRLAAVCGAYFQFHGEACLVIDCGTCITYDLLDSSGSYAGGAISPGLNMKFKALNTFTQGLPLVEPKEAGLIGNSTKTSIQNGVINGTSFEMQGFIDHFMSLFSNLRVLLCGGDISFFENKLKGPIFVAPNLVLYGLNRILLHNVE